MTREQWLEKAVDMLRPFFDEIGRPLPEQIHVSVGFAYGARRENGKILGQCWKSSSSDDGMNHIFISPEIGTTVDVLETLTHELVHVADDCENGHKGRFREIATMIGLQRPMTYTPVPEWMREKFMDMANTLGHYSHGRIDTSAAQGHSGPSKQGTYLRKVSCPSCQYMVRVTKKHLEQGLPLCPDGEEMEEVTA